VSYKRRELRVMKDGYYDLARAVLHQWNTDGRPQGDVKGVTLWAELVASHQQKMIGGVRHGELRTEARSTTYSD
jgi:hypothetical protein